MHLFKAKRSGQLSFKSTLANYSPVVLARNLRRSLLQGSPWIYSEALHSQGLPSQVSFCQIKDHKKNFVGWGVFCPKNAIAVRVLSLSKNKPTERDFAQAMQRAWNLRKDIISPETNCFRLFNGEGDLLPGLVCDIYGSLAVLQFDGEELWEFWDQDFIAEWILKNTDCETVFYKPRHDMKHKSQLWGEPIHLNRVEVVENGCRFYVDVEAGQKTGFFLDQRENRNYIKHLSQHKSVLNLFSYSGGFSVAAGCGQARNVTSVDIASGAIELANENWKTNNLSEKNHLGVCSDVFEFIHEVKEKFDVVICDPPSLAKSEKTKPAAVKKYVETFAAASKCVVEGGHLVLSSCSSHISFSDFFDITQESLSASRKRGQIIRVSGQGADHPYPHACPQLRYLKFVDLTVYQ